MRMNVEKLSEMMRSDGTAKALFEAVASIERPRPITDLRRLKNRVAKDKHIILSTDDVLEWAKQLQAGGFGTIINRRTSVDPYRFKWKYNLVDVAKTALGQHEPKQTPGAPMNLSGDTLTVPFPIRGRIFNIQIPSDMTSQEANDLASFIARFAR
jgi:hypothetical protein